MQDVIFKISIIWQGVKASKRIKNKTTYWTAYRPEQVEQQWFESPRPSWAGQSMLGTKMLSDSNGTAKELWVESELAGYCKDFELLMECFENTRGRKMMRVWAKKLLQK